ncbi:MAG TPA: inositol 2-dehydrogenase, partial [Roseiflexaceae bacterium]|nr:inositol 2-dehydrogenase [Roseiflexaceae bacterium]
MTELRIAVIGAGRIGRMHAEHLAQRIDGARLAAIADVAEAAAAELAARFGVPHTTDYHALLEDHSIDAVAICSSTDSHARMITEAAQAGKQIFCEKPIALDLPTIDAALASVAQAGVALQIGFQRRFDPSFRAAREAIAGGAIGTPHLLRITSRDPGPPPLDYIRRSGGLFLDMMIHDFDMARFLLGDEVVAVSATGTCLVDPAIGTLGDIDTAIVTLTFAGGAIGVIDNSRRAVYGYDQRAEVLGDAGAVAVDNRAQHTATVRDAQAAHGALPPHFFIERY